MATTALTKITTRAKQLKKLHPTKKWTDLIKAASTELKKKGSIGKPAKKAATVKTTAKKILVKVAKTKKGDTILNIGKAKAVKPKVVASYTYEVKKGTMSGINLAELEKNVQHLAHLQKLELATKTRIKDPKFKTEAPYMRRELMVINKSIAATKKHITALKRGI
jgi:hypothetical protein